MTTQVYTTAEQKQIALTILQQLGGNKFLAMTGAKVKYFGESDKMPYLQLELKPNKSKAKYLRISLRLDDTYNIVFEKISKDIVQIVKSLEGVYCDMLVEIFERTTGFYTKLF